ncbi:hypothetical protein DENSPDRAFT_886785 [Dentipellis sp. KUC8613]|nr:hypothetical protein DENSPDRAFT_886785 [Dentipellis sp. KUC8613]
MRRHRTKSAPHQRCLTPHRRRRSPACPGVPPLRRARSWLSGAAAPTRYAPSRRHAPSFILTLEPPFSAIARPSCSTRPHRTPITRLTPCTRRPGPPSCPWQPSSQHLPPSRPLRCHHHASCTPMCHRAPIMRPAPPRHASVVHLVRPSFWAAVTPLRVWQGAVSRPPPSSPAPCRTPANPRCRRSPPFAPTRCVSPPLALFCPHSPSPAPSPAPTPPLAPSWATHCAIWCPPPPSCAPCRYPGLTFFSPTVLARTLSHPL